MARQYVMGFLFNNDRTGIVTNKRVGSSERPYIKDKFNAVSGVLDSSMDEKRYMSEYFSIRINTAIRSASLIKFAIVQLPNDVILHCYLREHILEYNNAVSYTSTNQCNRISVDSILSRQGEFKCVRHFPMLVNLAKLYKIKYDENGNVIIHNLDLRNSVAIETTTVIPPTPIEDEEDPYFGQDEEVEEDENEEEDV